MTRGTRTTTTPLGASCPARTSMVVCPCPTILPGTLGRTVLTMAEVSQVVREPVSRLAKEILTAVPDRKLDAYWAATEQLKDELGLAVNPKRPLKERPVWPCHELSDTSFLMENDRARLSFREFVDLNKPDTLQEMAFDTLAYLQVAQKLFPVSFSQTMAAFCHYGWYVEARQLQDIYYGWGSTRSGKLIDQFANGKNIHLNAAGKAKAAKLKGI